MNAIAEMRGALRRHRWRPLVVHVVTTIAAFAVAAAVAAFVPWHSILPSSGAGAGAGERVVYWVPDGKPEDQLPADKSTLEGVGFATAGTLPLVKEKIGPDTLGVLVDRDIATSLSEDDKAWLQEQYRSGLVVAGYRVNSSELVAMLNAEGPALEVAALQSKYPPEREFFAVASSGTYPGGGCHRLTSDHLDETNSGYNGPRYMMGIIEGHSNCARGVRPTPDASIDEAQP